jgi:DNA-binding NarL/FixJ family response regulator
LDLTTQIKQRYPATRVVVISGDESPGTLASAADAGADDFRSKSVSLSDLLSALADPVWQPPASQGDPSADELATTMPPAEGPELTPREREILNLLAQGRTPKHIARELEISINTCRVHIRAILDKLGVHSQLAAVVQAARLGLFAQE